MFLSSPYFNFIHLYICILTSVIHSYVLTTQNNTRNTNTLTNIDTSLTTYMNNFYLFSSYILCNIICIIKLQITLWKAPICKQHNYVQATDLRKLQAHDNNLA